MMRLIPKKLWFYITIGMLVFHCATRGEWSSEPPTKIFYLCQEYDQDWFHISQSCRLWIEAEDRDSYNDTPQSGNRIRPDLCSWYGKNLSDRTGLETVWEPTHFTTSANEVYALVNDNPYYPGGLDTDDSPAKIPPTSLKTWEVMGVISIGGSSKVITESGWGSGVDGTSTSISGDLACGPVTADTSPHATDDGPRSMNMNVNVTFHLGTVPNNAETYDATGRADVNASMSGTLSASTDDDDLDPFGGGSMSYEFNKGFIPNINEGCESVAGIRFSFYSNVLDSGGEMCRVAKASGDRTNDGSVDFHHQDPDDAFAGLIHGGVTRWARIMIKGYVEANGYAVYVPEMGRWVYYNSKASISSFGSYTFAVTNVSASNLWYSPKTRYIPDRRRRRSVLMGQSAQER